MSWLARPSPMWNSTADGKNCSQTFVEESRPPAGRLSARLRPRLPSAAELTKGEIYEQMLQRGQAEAAGRPWMRTRKDEAFATPFPGELRGRPDILVHLKEVVRIVLRLDLGESPIVCAIGRGNFTLLILA